MIPEAAEVRLTPEDRAVLEARVRAPSLAIRTNLDFGNERVVGYYVGHRLD